MRAAVTLVRKHSRFMLPIALCLGVLTMAGCPRMPRVGALNASPSPAGSVSPSPTPTPTPAPTPDEDPTLQVLAVGTSPVGVALDATGNGFVTFGGSSGDILRVIKAAGDLSEAATTSLAVSGQFDAIVLSGGVAWVADTGNQQLRRINPSNDEKAIGPIDDFNFGGMPTALTLDAGDNLWAADFAGKRVGALSATSLLGATPVFGAVSGSPADLLADAAGFVWSLGDDNGQLSKIPSSLTGGSLSVQDLSVTYLTRGKGLARDSSGGLWATGFSGIAKKLVKFDGSTGALLREWPLTFQPGRLAIRRNYAWVLEAKLDPSDPLTPTSIYRVSLLDGTISSPYNLEGAGTRVVADPSGDLWVPVPTRRAVVRLDF